MGALALQKLCYQGVMGSTGTKHSSVPIGMGCHAQRMFHAVKPQSTTPPPYHGTSKGGKEDKILCNNTKNVPLSSPKCKSLSEL